MGNFFPVGKSNAKKSYFSKEECEAAEGQACFDITGLNPSDYDVVDGALVLNEERAAATLAAIALEERVKQRITKQEKAFRVIALMGILNEDKELSSEQIQSFLSTYQPIMLMLLSLSIPTARAMIAAITPDGVIVTESDKTKILAEMDS